MTRSIRVTDHALIRYLERGWGVDMKLHRQSAMAGMDGSKKISDYMLVEYLEYNHGFNVQNLRDRIARIATDILDKNSDIATLVESGDYRINSNGLVFRFRVGKYRTALITILGNKRNGGVLSNRAVRIRNQYERKNRKNR